MPSTGLSGLETVNDLLLYRLGRLVSTGGSLVVQHNDDQLPRIQRHKGGSGRVNQGAGR
jgi:hypothetical protein